MAKSDETNKKSKSNHAPRNSFRRGVRFVVILGIVILLAPTLLTLSGQHGAVLRLVNPRLAAAASFETLETHWWDPVQISRLEVADLTHGDIPAADRLPLLTAERISTKQSLWDLVVSGGSGIEFVAEQPVLNLEVHDGTTNLEATATRIFGATEDASADQSLPSLQVTVVDGTVRLVPDFADVDSASRWTTIGDISGTFSTLDSNESVPEVQLVASLRDGSESTDSQSTVASRMNPRVAASLNELAGDFPLIPFDDVDIEQFSRQESEHSISINIPAANPETGTRNATIEARHVDLAQVSPLISRLIPGLSCRGTLHGRIQARLFEQSASEGMAARVQVLGEDVHLRHSSWAPGEFAALDRVVVRGAGAIADDGMLLNQLEVHSAVVSLRGQGEVRHRSSTATVDGDAKVSDNEVRLAGSLDLAAVARMLPQTLQLHSDVSVKEGSVRFSARVFEDMQRSERETIFGKESAFQWQAALETSTIDAVRNGEPIQLQRPIRFDAAGLAAFDQVNLQRGRVSGDFGNLAVDPVEDSYSVSGTVNPDQLWKTFGQMASLPPLAIHGDVRVAATVRRTQTASEFRDLRLISNDVSVESDRFEIRDAGNIFERLAGVLTVKGNSAAVRLLVSPWHDASWLASDSRVAARLTGEPGRHVQVSAVVEPLSASHRSSSDGFVREATVDANITMDEHNHEYGIQKGLVKLPGAAASFAGTMSAADGVLVANVTAEVEYDLAALSGMVSEQVRLIGNGRNTVHITGAPSLMTRGDVERFLKQPGVRADASERVAPLVVTGGIQWQGGEAYGLPIGAGSTAVQVRDGLLRCEPVAVSLGSGTLNVMPQWDLLTNRVQLAPGSRVENLSLTQELAGEWLGYVSPLVSDAANVSGSLSCRVQQFDWNLNNSRQSQVRGTLTIHAASAIPGPSLTPLLQVAESISRRDLQSRQLVFPQQEIPIELRDGMVIHNGLQFGVAGYDVSSFGAVGLDGRIQVTLDVPLERSSPGQQTRSVQIPVQGTVRQPRLDVANLLQNVGRQQIENKVQDEVNRGLNRLLDKLGR